MPLLNAEKNARFLCCLDESGTTDSERSVVAGLNLRAGALKPFHRDWKGMLNRHGLESLHMRSIGNDCRSRRRRRALLVEAVGLINVHKHSSLTGALDIDQYSKFFGKRFRKGSMSPYGMCFIICVFMNHLNARHNKFAGLIDYALDRGNTRTSHIEGGYKTVTERQREGTNFHMGHLNFYDDRQFCALQAADLVAWAALRRVKKISFKGYEPLNDIFDQYHLEADHGNFLSELASKLSDFDLS